MYKVLVKCPVCGSKLKIKKLQCGGCNTIIENDFSFSKFDFLTSEQIKFVETFLKCRGNIKDVEKALGISYPTVRSKLEEVNEVLGLNECKDNELERQNIISKLEAGEISSEKAIELLNQIK